MRPRRPGRRAAAWSCLGVSAALMAQGTGPVAASALETCAAIAASASRLACYDKLAGRPATAQEPSAPVAAATAAAAAVGAPAAAAAAPQQSFGLYAAEHPAPASGSSLMAKVLEVRPSANGHATLVLEGGQVWELEEPDALLASGDAITIRARASALSDEHRAGSHAPGTPLGKERGAGRLPAFKTAGPKPPSLRSACSFFFRTAPSRGQTGSGPAGRRHPARCCRYRSCCRRFLTTSGNPR